MICRFLHFSVYKLFYKKNTDNTNFHPSFPESKLTSSDVLFCPTNSALNKLSLKRMVSYQMVADSFSNHFSSKMFQKQVPVFVVMSCRNISTTVYHNLDVSKCVKVAACINTLNLTSLINTQCILILCVTRYIYTHIYYT